MEKKGKNTATIRSDLRAAYASSLGWKAYNTLIRGKTKEERRLKKENRRKVKDEWHLESIKKSSSNYLSTRIPRGRHFGRKKKTDKENVTVYVCGRNKKRRKQVKQNGQRKLTTKTS